MTNDMPEQPTTRSAVMRRIPIAVAAVLIGGVAGYLGIYGIGGLKGAGGDPTKNPSESGELVRFLGSLAGSHPEAAGYWPAQGVAFGPVPVNGTFSYANGTRLYYANLATNLTDTKIEQGGINADIGITVSHIDNLTSARVADQKNWSKPSSR